MKKRLLAIMLCALMLSALLPTAAFAASGTKDDPIPLKVGETVTIPAGTDAYFSFTPPEDGVYTLKGLGTVYASDPIESDVNFVYESGFFHGGFTYRFKMNGSVFDETVEVLDGGRLYTETTTFGRQEYLIWDFDPDTGTLTIDNGTGDGKMANCGRELYPWDPLEAQIKRVVIGEGVTEVADDAFSGMLVSTSNSVPIYAVLETVSFPSTLKSIGNGCFWSCGALKTVSFPAALESIDYMSFDNCISLESVTFAGPTDLSSMINNFNNCTALADVTVPPNMRDFGSSPFWNSPWIRKLAAENKGAAVVNNVLIGAYAAYDKKEDDGVLVIPDGVNKIAPYALSGTGDVAGGEEGSQVDWYLSEVVIPDSVKEIGKNAFAYCINLERVTIGDGVTTIPESCFSECFELRTLNFGKNVKNIEKTAFYDTWLPGDLVIPDSVVTIGKQAFHNDEFPLGATWINHDGWGGVFEDIPYRPKDFTDRTITIGPAVTEIGAKAFYGWTVVSDDESMPGGTATIQGYDGTCAQQWAEKNDFKFESLGPASAAPASSGAFSDVPADAYYAEAVKWAVSHDPQITNGIGDGKFGPSGTVTRAQAVTFLWRAANCPEPEDMDSPFKDVTDPSAWYYKAVLWAAEKGITNGVGDDMYDLNGTLAYNQMLTFMCRAAGGDTSGDWSGKALNWAKDKGLTSGLTITAKGSCPRSDVVYFLWKQMA
ncbi:MAG: leucine-rich repeat protein [Oscillospiraceae bacterium]|nr:leucine-rich repeat protein [Oscillospiraceae bacterium]